MPYLHPGVLDFGLAALADATALHLCASEPATYAAALSASLGAKAAPELSAPEDAFPTGRRVTVAAFTGAPVTGTGTGRHWALVDAGAGRLLAAGSMAASVAVLSGGTWRADPFAITLLGV